MESEHIIIQNLEDHFERVDDILEDYLVKNNITGKNATRFSLLTEEGLRLAKSLISSSDRIELWLEGNSRVSHVCITFKTIMTANKQEKFLSLSTVGENEADATFFDKLKDTIIKHKKPTWSLAEYEAELRMRREQDKYSQDSWDDLERSVLANLADDIAVGVKDDYVLIIIRKDFTKSINQIGSRKPIITSQQILFSNDPVSIKNALDKIDTCTKELHLNPKNELQMRLLFEELIGMIEPMTGEFTALLWADKYVDECAIRLLCYTKMDIEKKEQLISMTSDKKNALAKGFMGKIRDIVETGILNYDGVMKLQQQYNGQTISYAALGTYCDLGAGLNPAAISGMSWSLNDYKKALSEDLDSNEAAQSAWDELEKSIVANIANDVLVGIKKDHVEITIVKNIKEEK